MAANHTRLLYSGAFVTTGPVMSTQAPRIWLRAETKMGEARRALCPRSARALLDAGYEVVVERSDLAAIGDDEYATAGVQLAPAGSWRDSPLDTYILGLKELPDDNSALPHTHIYFAHAYKQQRGWQALLQRFAGAQGTLLDLEYLLDDNQRRVAAFGYWAGYAGAALGVLNWCRQQHGGRLTAQRGWADQHGLLEELRAALEGIPEGAPPPRIIVIGALGRVGAGARALADALSLEVTPWDMAETAAGGPFEALLAHAIFVNCVLVNKPMPPFITPAMLQQPRALSVIADVSCDPYGDYNPVPLYSECTSAADPALRLVDHPAPLDIIAIDNLPSLLPRESTQDFSAQLLPTLLEIQHFSPTWQRAEALFHQHCQTLETTP